MRWKYSVHMYVYGKMRPVETIPEMGGEGGIKENDGGGEFNYSKNFGNVTMFPQYNNNMVKKKKKKSHIQTTKKLQKYYVK
jgi:hypothetical protein